MANKNRSALQSLRPFGAPPFTQGRLTTCSGCVRTTPFAHRSARLPLYGCESATDSTNGDEVVHPLSCNKPTASAVIMADREMPQASPRARRRARLNRVSANSPILEPSDQRHPRVKTLGRRGGAWGVPPRVGVAPNNRNDPRNHRSREGSPPTKKHDFSKIYRKVLHL